ncbi:hypothetical protein FO519_010321, partial [Halicephalobus sp. NKZ332]
MVEYNIGSNEVVPWLNDLSIGQIQNQVVQTPQDSNVPFSLKHVLGALTTAVEGLDLTLSIPIGVTVFVTDTTTPGSIDGADEFAAKLKSYGVKLTFILMGPGVDQNKLTNFTTNFVTWSNLASPQPDNWDANSAFA